jgi:ubiquinone/menaquinone biosynthesis C-methylase UbiE
MAGRPTPTRTVDYDSVSGQYDRRYEATDYTGVKAALLGFAGSLPESRILEVGTGTGHWLRVLREAGRIATGLDLSAGMLARARELDKTCPLVRARAEEIPFIDRQFDRLFCINALHHFADRARFLAEAHRVLRRPGGFMTVTLDPSTERDRWWIYDFFPETRQLDKTRYPAGTRIRKLMIEAGFVRCETHEVEHIQRQLPVRQAQERGFLDRTSTSQLTILSEEQYQAGIDRIAAAAAAAGSELILEADLRLYGTTGWLE